MPRKRMVWTTGIGAGVLAAAVGAAAAFGPAASGHGRPPVKSNPVVKHRPAASNPGYWTEDRMRNAKPYPMEVGESPSQAPGPNAPSGESPRTVPPGTPTTKP